jgi:hypothetical protein
MQNTSLSYNHYFVSQEQFISHLNPHTNSHQFLVLLTSSIVSTLSTSSFSLSSLPSPSTYSHCHFLVSRHFLTLSVLSPSDVIQPAGIIWDVTRGQCRPSAVSLVTYRNVASLSNRSIIGIRWHSACQRQSVLWMTKSVWLTHRETKLLITD